MSKGGVTNPSVHVHVHVDEIRPSIGGLSLAEGATR